jgi:hypothetical protein
MAPPRVGAELAADRAARMRRDAAQHHRARVVRDASRRRAPAGGHGTRRVAPAALRRVRALAATMLSALRV